MTYAYCRKPVSEDDNQQIIAVNQWAERWGVHIDKMFLEDEKTSKNTYDKREIGTDLLPIIKEGDCLVLAEITCAGRSARELDNLINNVFYKKKIRFVCLSLNINIDFANLTNEDEDFLDKIAFAAQLQTLVVKEYTSYALKLKKHRGKNLGAKSNKWRDKYNNKTEEQKLREQNKKAKSKIWRFLRKKDNYVFLKILKTVFPEETVDDNLYAWNWENINTKNGKYLNILSLMKQCHDIDSELFPGTDLEIIKNAQKQTQLSMRIHTLKRSLNNAKKYKSIISLKELFGIDTIESLGITTGLAEKLNPVNIFRMRKTDDDDSQLAEFKPSGIKISTESITKFKVKK